MNYNCFVFRFIVTIFLLFINLNVVTSSGIIDGISEEVDNAHQQLKKIQEVASTSRQVSSIIGERVAGIGFDRLSFTVNSGRSKYKTSKYIKIDLEIFLDSLAVSSSLRKSADAALNSLIEDIAEEKTIQNIQFTFTSPVSGGTINIGYFSFSYDKNEDRWYDEYYSLQGEFRTMPDWYIRTNTVSKKPFLKSSHSVSQEIVYVETGITEKAVAEMMMISMPDLAGLRNKMLSKF